MSITDELREYARHLHNVWYDPLDNVYTYTTMDFAPSLDAVRLDGYVLAIADRIDAEHERRLEVLYHDMSDAEYVKLPVDADGVPIHIGDELECIEALHPEVPARFKVQDMLYCGNGEWHLRTYPATYDPKKCRHYHAPTVEDVLLELLNEAKHFHSLEEEQEAIAEYAAKLRLADE